jgi:hypothetical protein
MALTTVINNFITVAQLRAEIGRPTLDVADPGYIADTELEKIIQRYHDEAVAYAKFLAGERIEAGQLPADKESFVPITISLSVSATQPGLMEGTITDTYYPYVYQVQDEAGREYVYDANPGKTANTSFTRRFVYKTVGYKVYVSKGVTVPNPTTAYVHLATNADVWNYLFHGDLVRDYNNRIIAEATEFLNKTINEGVRLEQIYSTNDGVPGDVS